MRRVLLYAGAPSLLSADDFRESGLADRTASNPISRGRSDRAELVALTSIRDQFVSVLGVDRDRTVSPLLRRAILGA
jgi:hypothetical protein